MSRINKLKRNVINYIFTKTLDYKSKNSNYVKHAIAEFDLSGYADKDEMNALMRDQVIELLKVFASHGHSGFSYKYAIDLFTKLANFEIISPLTFEDKEFHQCDLMIEVHQNKRDSSVFKDTKGIYDIDAFTKSVTSSKFFGAEKIVKYAGGSWSGSPIFEVKNGLATGRGFKRAYFKDVDILEGCIPKKTIALPAIQIEVTPDDWLMFVNYNSSALKELNSTYRIDWFKVESLKDQPIINLTHNHGY